MVGRADGKGKSGTPTLLQPNQPGSFLSYTEAPFKILFDQRALRFTKCLKIADYFSNDETAVQRGEERCWYCTVLAGTPGVLLSTHTLV